MYKSRIKLLKCLTLVMIMLSLFIVYNHIRIYEINKKILINEDMLKVSNIDIKDLEYVNKNLLDLKVLKNYYSTRESVFTLITIVIPIIAVFIDFILQFKEKQNELEKEILILSKDMLNNLDYIFRVLNTILFLNDILKARIKEHNIDIFNLNGNLFNNLNNEELRVLESVYKKFEKDIDRVYIMNEVDILKYELILNMLSKSNIRTLMIYDRIIKDYKNIFLEIMGSYIELYRNKFKNNSSKIEYELLGKLSLISQGWEYTYKIVFIEFYNEFIELFKNMDRNVVGENIKENTCVNYFKDIKNYIEKEIIEYYV